MDPATLQNLLSGYKSLSSDLINLLRRGLGLRIQMDAIGYSLPFAAGTAAGPAMGAVQFPVQGFPQLQSADHVIAVLKALEELQAATESMGDSGQPHATAIARIAGGVA